MSAAREVRADFDRASIVVYQAYPDAIADVAVEQQKFGPPFSVGRMTWIKPSFLWLMHRSNWGSKSGQERTLAVRIKRSAWEEALSLAVLTSYEPKVHGTQQAWREAFESAPVIVQWDPERTLRGAGLPHDSIQVGLSRAVIQRFVDDWTVSITDLTPLVRKLRKHLDDGRADQATRLLPKEAVYPVPPEPARRLGM
ncbi:DUF4291 domain-containing protein [Corallococcus praedator]|uniref:DUF4291 domain-containing protein n=1 Tax=Corallococcus praedator TaxID=2316724 RepID=A0ABX9QM59_9BACT|nr:MULTISPECIES: DUF4291 domain-containing protein [Corallococcus]RKH13021.1 DUF4291 domain-containing protein [Corallococcus sp. CA047B]RKH27849.1 DUF4291 domain-containing protein [Corallococcus sp. CA031C]RKI11765.1 DUF4291 domain-containing protein [Corallococcus praedator]